MKKITGKTITYGLVLFLFAGCSKRHNPATTPPVTPPVVVGKLAIYPAPGASLNTVEHLTQSHDYTVEVRRAGKATYQNCFVYKKDNYWADTYFGGPNKVQASASFTSFAFSGTSVEIKTTCSAGAANVTVRPLAFDINPMHTGNVITFAVTDPKKISVEINDRRNPLFIFAGAPDVPNTAATYYYGPGVHSIGLAKVINSSQSVYIAAGAVVEGSFLLPYNTSNISTKGRGILCMGEWPHQSTDITWLGAHSGTKGNGTSNLQIEGIIMANTTGWSIPIYNSDKLTYNNQFRNIKMISFNSGYKSIANLLFDNITIDDKNPDEVDLYGTAAGPVNGVTFKNLKFNGVKVMSLAEAAMDANSFAANIVF